MKNGEKRTYVSMKKQDELLAKFVQQHGGAGFTTADLLDWFDQFEWFRKLSKNSRESRVFGFISILKKKYGENLKKMNRTRPYLWKIESETPKIKDPEVRNFGKLGKLVSVVYNSKLGGISKKDAAKILGYKDSNAINTGVICSINERIERATGFKPFMIDKTHTFVSYDVITINKEMASLIIESYKELQDITPLSLESEYEKDVKAMIRRDYNNLKLFEKSGKIRVASGDGERFRKSVIGEECLGADKLAERYQEVLKARYGVELEVFGQPRKEYGVGSLEDLKLALDTIKYFFAETFGEEIIHYEKPETPTIQLSEEDYGSPEFESNILGILKDNVFKGKQYMMTLPDIWKNLENLGIKRGWGLLELLKKHPENFRVEMNSKPGYVESEITYIPTIEPKIQQEVEEEYKPESPKVEEKVTTKLEVLVGLQDRDYKLSELLEPQEFQKYREDYIYSITVDLGNKKSILEYLKLYYKLSGRDQTNCIIAKNKYETIRELEALLTE